jgi:hypothetical protein
LVADVLCVQGLDRQGDRDGRHLAFDGHRVLAGLNRFILVLDGLGANVSGLVETLHTALQHFGNVDGVEDSAAHAADDDLVVLGLAFSTGEQVDGVLDVHTLAV